MHQLVEFLKFLLPSMIALGVAWMTGRWNWKSKQTENTSAPYSELAKRVGRLEQQNASMLMFIAAVVPLHADITLRWPHYRQQEVPPIFPIYTSDKDSNVQT